MQTSDWQPVFILLVLVLAAIALLHAAAIAARAVREPLLTGPFSGGREPREHPLRLA